ncbi:MAG: hypothetical protein J5826_02900 [Bacteroidales bacterium]|nr:hypothetical protein [Bacteroidales bacterium]
MSKTNICTIVFAVLAFLFWGFIHPEWLSYHEQYQLFLFSSDYLLEHLALPGGFVVWLSEFFVQFFYNRFLGAAVVSIVLTLIFVLLRRNGNDIFALIPSVLLWIYSGDQSMLFAFPVAVLAAVSAYVLFHKIDFKHKNYFQFLFIAVIYWLIGYGAFIYTILVGVDIIIKSDQRSKNVLFLGAQLLFLCVLILYIGRFIIIQYPFCDLFFGIDYYRLHMTTPFWQHLVAASCILTIISVKLNKILSYSILGVIAVGGVWGVISSYNFETYNYFKIDYYVRYQKWDSLLDYVKRNNLKSDFASTGVNLALAETGQLPQHLFDYNQTGSKGMLTEFDYTCFSCGPTAEACYRLGLVNSVLRYNFDMQAAILNCKNSGRFFKRIAEAYIINNRSDVARMYINKLKQTLFYRSWALSAEECLTDRSKINSNPEWSNLVKYQYCNGLNFSNSHLIDMLLILFNNNTDNRMALDYALSLCLINRDLNSFVKHFPLYTANFGTSNVPDIYQQAFLFACIQSGLSLDAIPKFITDDVKTLFREFDTACLLNYEKAMSNKKFSNTFWKYYLSATN